MLKTIPIGKAAAMLYAALRQKKALLDLPEDCRPDSPFEAYAIQDRFVALLGKPVGYKIAFTNPAIQKKLKIDEPASGRLIADRVFASPTTINVRSLFRVGVETEFAFRMAKDLPATGAPYAPEQVGEAIDVLVPAIEIVDTRFADWTTCGALQAIADNALGSHWVYGAPYVEWQGLDLVRAEAVTSVNGRVVGQGVGANVMGDPLAALTWLANDLASRRMGLGAGDYITTGACSDIVMARAGDRVVADFGRLGQVEVALE
jgi:2-keto-4-pentenoate hydratase